MDVNVIRSRLEQEQKRLNEELEQLNASRRSITMERREGSPYGKKEEEANGAAGLEKRLALESRIRNTLVQVEHASHKIDEGTYGICDNCGQLIDRARLEALPQAALCVTCKTLQEGRGNRNGGLPVRYQQTKKGERKRRRVEFRIFTEN